MKKQVIDVNALIERYDKRIEWLRLDVHDKYSLGLYHEAATGKDLIAKIPTEVAFTEEQLSTILQAAYGLETRNQKLEKELVRLKNCLNCKIRKECPRHCGKVVHGCDHWEYGDSTMNAVEVVRCKDCRHWKEGYGMQGICYHFNDETDDDDFCSYGERGTDERKDD